MVTGSVAAVANRVAPWCGGVAYGRRDDRFQNQYITRPLHAETIAIATFELKVAVECYILASTFLVEQTSEHRKADARSDRIGCDPQV